MTKRQLRGRLGRAKRRLSKERRLLRLCQRRLIYWSNRTSSLEDRFGAVKQGQVEMDLENTATAD